MTHANQDAGARLRRFSSPVTERDGLRIVDIDYYAPFLLNAVSSAWHRKTSAIYRDRFGLGIAEWRLLSMLNIEPDITAARICEVLRMDKAAASRTLKRLNDWGLILYEAPASDPRKRRWRLSPEGLTTHDRILAIALDCEAEMVADVPPEELEVFLSVLRRMLATLDAAET